VSRRTFPGFREINLDASAKLEAHAEDMAGNVEKRPHVITH
jgi:hypothetical protein